MQYFSRINKLQLRVPLPNDPMVSFSEPRCVHSNNVTYNFHILALVYVSKACVNHNDGETYRVVTQTQALEMGLPRRGRELTQMPCVRFHSYNGTGTTRAVAGRYYLKSHVAIAVERHWRRYARNKRHPQDEWRTLLSQHLASSVVGKTKAKRKSSIASQTRGVLPNICFLQQTNLDQSAAPKPERILNKDLPSEIVARKKVGRPAIRTTFHKTVHVIGLGGLNKEMYETHNKEERRKLLMRERQRARRKLVHKKIQEQLLNASKDKQPGVVKPPQPPRANPAPPAAPANPATPVATATPDAVVSTSAAAQLATIQRQQLAVIQQQQQQLAAMQRQQQVAIQQQRVAQQQQQQSAHQRPNVWNPNKAPVTNV